MFEIFRYCKINNLAYTHKLYKAKNSMLPVNLQNMFITIEEIHSYGTRSSKNQNVNVKFCKMYKKKVNVN